jgi:hypothetical protein
MSLTDMWKNMRERLATQKSAPAEEVLPRLRDSAKLRALGNPATPAGEGEPADSVRAGMSSLGEVTPFANEIQAPSEPSIPPPPWDLVYPGHHKALVGDLARRGENISNWEIQDGRDMGVSESGHTVAFTLHKTGTSATIQVELTLFKGQLARVRVH